jgi:hypothetical protein
MTVQILGVLLLSSTIASQAPPPKPEIQARPAPRAATASVAMTVQVTDGSGAVLQGVQVHASGPVEREGKTSVEGGLKFTSLKAGTYRLRFSRDGFITLERDVTIRAGQPATVEVMMSAAPPPPPPPEPPKPVAPAPAAASSTAEATGDPKVTAVPDFVQDNFIGRAPRKDSPLGCVASGAATLVQLREALAEQSHDAADQWFYVVAGEATLRIDEREQRLAAGGFAVVPRTMKYSLVPRGRNPLIVVSILTGQRCEEGPGKSPDMPRP